MGGGEGLDQGSQTQSVSRAAGAWKHGLAGRIIKIKEKSWVNTQSFWKIEQFKNLHFSWCSRTALDPLAGHMQPAGYVFETTRQDSVTI